MSNPPLLQTALGDLEHELAITRRVLERVPDEHLGWQPHRKSSTLGALAGHLANIVALQVLVLDQEEFDGATARRPQPPTSREEVLGRFDANVATLRERLAATDEARLGEPWTMKAGGRVAFTLPRVAALRALGISHLVHHRGQLSVYLRLLDVPVPSIYGPSADEAPF